MTLVSRSIPGLFGGVSQQIPALRHPTQCSEQSNGLATLVDGLYKRPGTQFAFNLPLNGTGGASVAGSYGNCFVHTIDKDDAGLFQLIIVNSNLMLYNLLTGAAETVTFSHGNSYLASSDPANDFRVITVADYTFVVNTTKTVALKSTTSALNPVDVAYINVRTAVPNVTYTVSVDGVDSTITAGDAPTNASIAASLTSALANQWTGSTVFVVPGTSVIKFIRNSVMPVNCVCSDGWGNTAIQTVHNGVDTFADLPPKFDPSGFVVAINGSASSAKDKYFVTWNGERWVETTKPGIQTTLDEMTMPFQLRPTGTGSWVFEKNTTWGKRLAGDDDTNPVPSFVGTKIRNVFFHRNRLGFLADDAMVLSRSGRYFDFFSTTATQVLETDPIDINSTVEDVDTLDWAIPYNDVLLVWASSDQQFTLQAGDILSPSTARLVPSTQFESFNGTRPTSIGNTLLFASTVGSNAQINRYRVAENRVTNTVDDVTSHVPRYVPARPRKIEVSTTVKAAVLVPKDPSIELVLFKYEVDEKDELTQKAWAKLQLTLASDDVARVVECHWRSRTLYITMHVKAAADPVPSGRFVVHTFNVETQAQDQNVGFQLCLDSRALVIGGSFDGTNTTISVPYLTSNGITALRCVDGSEPVELVAIGGSIPDTVNLRTLFTVQGNHTGATIWVGRKFNFRYVFTEVFFRDTQGLPIMEANLKLVRMLVRYVTTGYFMATVSSLLRGAYTYPVSGRTVGMPGQGASQLSLSTGSYAIPVHAKAADASVVIESDSYFPCKFPYAEWVGDVNMKAQR